MVIKEKLLFAAHGGTISTRPAAIIMQDHCLPIACEYASWTGHGGSEAGLCAPVAEAGIYACWEATRDVEEFFAALGFGAGIEHGPGESNRHIPPPNGLWVYTVEYDADEMSDDRADEWPWLRGGTLRRPTAEELEPLTRGEAPWGGVVL